MEKVGGDAYRSSRELEQDSINLSNSRGEDTHHVSPLTTHNSSLIASAYSVKHVASLLFPLGPGVQKYFIHHTFSDHTLASTPK